MLNISKNTFTMDDLKAIQNHFHELIIERAKQGWNCSAFLADENKVLPEITNETYIKTQKEQAWYPVPGMYGGFAYQLTERNGKPLLVTKSWSRVVGGSGQRHEITTDGYVLVGKRVVQISNKDGIGEVSERWINVSESNTDKNVQLINELWEIANMQFDLQQQGGQEKNGVLFEQILEKQDEFLEKFGLPVNHPICEQLIHFKTTPTDDEISRRIKHLQELAIVFLSGDAKTDIQVLKEAQYKQREAFYVLPELSLQTHVYTLFVFDEILLKGKDSCENILQELKLVSQSYDILNTLGMLEYGQLENENETIECLEKSGLRYIRQFAFKGWKY